jgi:hypothetical protein
LLGADGVQNIARLGNMGEIYLGLDFVGISTAGASGPAGGLCFAGGVEVGPHFFRFVVFNGTGMSLLLRDSDHRKYVQNGLTLDFQFSGQIVDSNLAHPPFLSSGLSR